MGLSKIYQIFEVSIALPVPKIWRRCHAMAGPARGVHKLTRGSPSSFYPTAVKSGVNIVEWSMLNVNVLDFRHMFAL